MGNANAQHFWLSSAFLLPSRLEVYVFRGFGGSMVFLEVGNGWLPAENWSLQLAPAEVYPTGQEKTSQPADWCCSVWMLPLLGCPTLIHSHILCKYMWVWLSPWQLQFQHLSHLSRQEFVEHSFPVNQRFTLNSWQTSHFSESGLPTPMAESIYLKPGDGRAGSGPLGGAALEPCSVWTSSAARKRPSPVPPEVSAERAKCGNQKGTSCRRYWIPAVNRSIMIQDDTSTWIVSREKQWKHFWIP